MTAYYNEFDKKAAARAGVPVLRGDSASGPLERDMSDTKPKPLSAICNYSRYARRRCANDPACGQRPERVSRRMTRRLWARLGSFAGIGRDSPRDLSWLLCAAGIVVLSLGFSCATRVLFAPPLLVGNRRSMSIFDFDLGESGKLFRKCGIYAHGFWGASHLDNATRTRDCNRLPAGALTRAASRIADRLLFSCLDYSISSLDSQ